MTERNSLAMRRGLFSWAYLLLQCGLKYRLLGIVCFSFSSYLCSRILYHIKNKHQGKMRRTVSTLLLLLFVVIAEAQNLTGKVIDSKTQEAIIGATVTLKGSKK